MLILTREIGESIHIGKDVKLTVLAVDGNQVKLGTRAPPSVVVLREEVAERMAAKALSEDAEAR